MRNSTTKLNKRKIQKIKKKQLGNQTYLVNEGHIVGFHFLNINMNFALTVQIIFAVQF